MKNRSAKKTALCAVILALALFLTACGGQETPAPPEEAAGFKPRLDTQTDCSLTVAGH